MKPAPGVFFHDTDGLADSAVSSFIVDRQRYDVMPLRRADVMTLRRHVVPSIVRRLFHCLLF